MSPTAVCPVLRIKNTYLLQKPITAKRNIKKSYWSGNYVPRNIFVFTLGTVWCHTKIPTECMHLLKFRKNNNINKLIIFRFSHSYHANVVNHCKVSNSVTILIVIYCFRVNHTQWQTKFDIYFKWTFWSCEFRSQNAQEIESSFRPVHLVIYVFSICRC